MNEKSQTVRTQKRGDERRKLILDAALELVAAGGLENITMTAVAKRVNMPVSSIYQYFGARQDIAMALASREIAKDRAAPASVGLIKAKNISEYKTTLLIQLRYIVDMMRNDAGYRYLLTGLDGSPQFSEIYRQNAPANYLHATESLGPLAPHLDREEIRNITVLVLSTIVTIGAKASQFKNVEEADKFVEEGLRMVWGHIVSKISEI